MGRCLKKREKKRGGVDFGRFIHMSHFSQQSQNGFECNCLHYNYITPREGFKLKIVKISCTNFLQGHVKKFNI